MQKLRSSPNRPFLSHQHLVRDDKSQSKPHHPLSRQTLEWNSMLRNPWLLLRLREHMYQLL
jgi:hypothetical protein